MVFFNILFVSTDHHLTQKGFSSGLLLHVIAVTIGGLYFILLQQKPYASASSSLPCIIGEIVSVETSLSFLLKRIPFT